MTETIEPMTTAQIDHQQRFAEELIDRARAEGSIWSGLVGCWRG
jgi:hypothetical protein